MKYFVPLLSSVLLVGAILLGGCDSFLRKDTSAQLTPDNFYETEEDLEAAVAAAWHPIIGGKGESFGSNSIWVPLMGSDDVTTNDAQASARFRRADRFKADPNEETLRQVHWKTPYQAIYRANTLLENLESSPVAQAVKDRSAAQVRFLRGWLYFWLTRLFGPVPIVLSPDADITAERAPVRKVYKQAIEDLKYAEEHLPRTWSGAPGKPVRLAATAMLGRVYLTMAGWPLNDQGKYSDARDKFREVMDSGRFRLLNDFSDLWQIENRFNDEYVFELSFCRDCKLSAFFTGAFHIPSSNVARATLLAEVGFFNDFPAGPRKEATFVTEFNGIPWQNHEANHPTYQKWLSGTSVAGDEGDNRRSSRTLPVIRYAHVLTGFAEAQAMATGTPGDAAYEAINRVRQRAGLSNLPRGLSAEAFRDSVVKERGWEFAGEFTRWFDLIRTEKVVQENIGDKAPQDLKPLRAIQGLPKKHFYWMPIPTSEVVQGPNIDQNPGYK